MGSEWLEAKALVRCCLLLLHFVLLLRHDPLTFAWDGKSLGLQERSYGIVLRVCLHVYKVNNVQIQSYVFSWSLCVA